MNLSLIFPTACAVVWVPPHWRLTDVAYIARLYGLRLRWNAQRRQLEARS